MARYSIAFYIELKVSFLSKRIHNYYKASCFQIDARGEEAGEVVFKDNFTSALAGIVEVGL